MKIARVVFRGLKALEQRDDAFTFDPSGLPAQSLCLRGVNGSGKTTYLEAVASLWQLFRRWSQRRKHVTLSKNDLLSRADLVAVRLVDLPGPAPDLWLVYGRHEAWESVPDRGESAVVGVLGTGNRGNMKNLHLRGQGQELLSFWNDRATRLEQPASRSGVESLPNMVLIGAEDRLIQPLRGDDLFELAPESSFRFLARYRASDKKTDHIENSLSALLAVDPDRFRAVASRIGQVLPHLSLLDRADAETRRPLVRLAKGAEVTLDQLSAGERAAVIALFTVARWLTSGGVVLIDEPELHQHISLMRTNLAVLERYIESLEGQLVVASHAPEVWDHYRSRGALIDLDEPRGDGVR